MRRAIIVMLIGLVIAGCVQGPPAPPGNNTTVSPPGNNTTITPPANNTTIIPPSNNTSAVPPGYEVADYCGKDGDCVRKNSCCDCGLGQYVNIYNQQPECPPDEPRCMCAIALSHGECRDNMCVAVAGGAEGNGAGGGNGSGPPPTGFCGTSTNGACSSDSDCISGGCSGQVCQSAAEPPMMTTCEYRECYNAQAYGASCGCAEGKCRWQ